MTHVPPIEFRELLLQEFRCFESDQQRDAFLSFTIEPERVDQRWSYGEETHACFIVARGTHLQIVYCNTGFGPEFPWSLQPAGETDLGSDAQWYAYLYECFVASDLWPHPIPDGFMLCGPGERRERER